MTVLESPSEASLRTSIATLLSEQVHRPEADALGRAVAEGFFHRSDDAYLAPRELAYVMRQWQDLAGWAGVRQPDEIKVRVFEPSHETHGYYLDRTVLQTCMTDQPFLHDTLMTLLASRGIEGVRCVHPILGITRDADGVMVAAEPLPTEALPAGTVLESMMHIEVPRLDEADRRDLLEEVTRRLTRCQAVVQDFEPMLHRARQIADRLDGASASEAEYFRWIAQDNLVFLGYAEYQVDGDALTPDPANLLGLRRVEAARGALSVLPPTIGDWAATSSLLLLAKGRDEAGIHRAGKVDLIGVRLGDRLGIFEGLYTRKAIGEDIHLVPLLRQKLEEVKTRQSVMSGSTLEAKLQRAFQAVPVEFLFEADIGQIEDALRLIMSAEAEQETRVHLLESRYGTSAFLLVSLPKDRFTDEVKQQVSARVTRLLGATYVDLRVSYGVGGSAVLQYYLTAGAGLLSIDEAEVAEAVTAITASWNEQLTRLLRRRFADTDPEGLLAARYASAFPEEFRSVTDVAEAAADVRALERVRTDGGLVVALDHGTDELVSGVTRLKLFQHENIFLTESAPVLDDFGLRVIDQMSVPVSTGDRQLYLDVFRVIPRERGVGLSASSDRLVEALEKVLLHEAPADRLNELVVSAGLDLHEVGVLRAYLGHARQLGESYTKPAVHAAWRRHPQAARLLMRLFRSRFKPAIGAADDPDRQRLVERNRQAFVSYLEGVDQVSDDRILRRTLDLLDATLRTNFFAGARLDGHPLALKIDCSKVDDMPSPRPYREIYISHMDIEGVHLRGGPVARGGLRWSDRPADFRTEILGLMDTQMVKNVLIVPVGAKGGFVLKRHYDTRAEARAAADDLYKVFIRGLLDVTDNVVDGEVVAPTDVLRYDGDDPYLVVAADKGTAHLSDTANSIAEAYGFWLGDAFASGGSAGYDHKKYGITAKGAWVCVRRHFREMAIDPEKDVITVVGIGDMSGDVFGNGLLLSRTMKLQAAFNHLHIFLDPDPDPGNSWTERKRLFELPRSTWDDYDKRLISEGGGIHPRHAKKIRLTPAVQQMLGTSVEQLSGDELVHELLKMEADLLWNGGIGTYVKASHETQRQAGDPANDAVRVDGRDLRFKVVGEGGNLGFTQAARVEFARAGGRTNTDAVDNSGGVDMSDHEVNLKILFTALMRQSTVTREQRDEVMLGIAEQVSADVQSNNHQHSLMISLDVVRAEERLDDFRVLLNDLELVGRLERGRHVLPDDGEMLRRMRAKEGLVRPEIARIGPFVKMQVYEALLADGRFYTPYVERFLLDYFPSKVRRSFKSAVKTHQLRAEIAATVITNRLVDGMGATHFSLMERVSGASVTQIAYASLLAAELLDAWTLKDLIRDLRGVRASVEYVKLIDIEDAVAQLALWLLQRPIDVLRPTEVLVRFKDGFRDYEAALPRIIDRSEKHEYQRALRYLRNRQIRVKNAERAAAPKLMVEAGEAMLLAEATGLEVVQAGMLLKAVAADSGLLRALQLADPGAARDGWEMRAISDQRAHIAELVGILARRALEGMDCRKLQQGRRGLSPALRARWTAYREQHAECFDRAARLGERIEQSRAKGLAPAMVLYGAIRPLKAE